MWKVPLFRILWDEDDVRSVTDAIRSGMNWASGPQIGQFEEAIAAYLGIPRCVTFNSGTSALHAALIAYGIGSGDEVIVPSFTFIATANAPRFVGARPVFADIEQQTYGLDPGDVLERITPRTRAIIPVHYGGCPCAIRELAEIAEDHRLILMEDAAEAFGAAVDGKNAGTFGDAGVLSFCQNKIITTGEGGAIVTESKEIADRLLLLRSHGRLETCDYFSTPGDMEYVTLGYNFRMSSLTAALGLAQMGKVDKILRKRRNNARYYAGRLAEVVPECSVAPVPGGYSPVYQLFSVRVPERDALMRCLEEQGIMTKIYFSPVHRSRYYRQTLDQPPHLPVTEEVAGEILSLPFHPNISRGDMDLVVRSMEAFYGRA
jgi:perosamine synthetase